MLKSIRARLQRVEAGARLERDLNIPPLEFVDERDFESREEFEAHVAEITSRYPPHYDGIKVMIVERPEWHNDESASAEQEPR
jgi:hypothetical protein